MGDLGLGVAVLELMERDSEHRTANDLDGFGHRLPHHQSFKILCAERPDVSAMFYRPVTLAEEAAFSWIRPIPRPPTAPASNPSRISIGMLSIIEDLTSLTIDSLHTKVVAAA